MRRTITSCAIGAVAILLLSVGSAAQETSPPSPQGDATPYEEYLAALEDFKANNPMAGLSGTPTTDEVVAAIEELIALAKADQVRLLAVVPEPCYALAHEEMYAYRESAIELYEDILPQLASAETVIDMVPIIGTMDADLRARHPTAYVEAPDAAGGFQGEPINILDALATCESPTGSPTLAASFVRPFEYAIPAGSELVLSRSGSELYGFVEGPEVDPWSRNGSLQGQSDLRGIGARRGVKRAGMLPA